MQMHKRFATSLLLIIFGLTFVLSATLPSVEIGKWSAGPDMPRPLSNASAVVLSDGKPGLPAVYCFPSPEGVATFRGLRPGQAVVITATVSTQAVLMPPSLPAGMTGPIGDLRGAIQAAALQPPREARPPHGFTLRNARLVREPLTP